MHSTQLFDKMCGNFTNTLILGVTVLNTIAATACTRQFVDGFFFLVNLHKKGDIFNKKGRGVGGT